MECSDTIQMMGFVEKVRSFFFFVKANISKDISIEKDSELLHRIAEKI